MGVNEELCLLASVRELYQPGVTDMRTLLTDDLGKVVAHAKDTLMARTLPCKPEQITVEAAKAFFHSHGVHIALEADPKTETKVNLATSNTESIPSAKLAAEGDTEAAIEAKAEIREGAEVSSDAEAEAETQQGESTKKARANRVGRPRRASMIPPTDDGIAHSPTTTGKRLMADTEAGLPPPGEEGSPTTIESSPIKRPRRSTRK